MFYKGFLDFFFPMSSSQAKGNLSFAGNGKVSVKVTALLKSENFKEQLKAVRDLRDLAQTTTINIPNAVEGVVPKAEP